MFRVGIICSYRRTKRAGKSKISHPPLRKYATQHAKLLTLTCCNPSFYLYVVKAKLQRSWETHRMRTVLRKCVTITPLPYTSWSITPTSVRTRLSFIVDNYPHIVSIYWRFNCNTNYELSIQNLPRVMTHTSRTIAT